MNTIPPYLEHANLSVQNLDSAIHFIQTAFPSFKVRGGTMDGPDKWVHLGTEESYLAINEKNQPKKDIRYVNAGINHLGFVVPDALELADRMLEAGYKRSYPEQKQRFRIREYFFDKDGNEYEFVEYLSNKTEERNDYSE